jgi:hypothetical protein
VQVTANNFIVFRIIYLGIVMITYFHQPPGGVLLERKDPECYAQYTINGQDAFNALDQEI